MSREVDRRSFSTTKLNLERETVLPNIATEVSKALPGQQRIRIERFDAVTGNPSEITAEDTLPEEGNFVERALDYVNNLRNVLSPTVISQVEFVPDSFPLVTNTGAASVHLAQHYKGIPIFGASEVVRFAPDGRIKNVVSTSFAIEQELPTALNISVEQAVKKAAEHVSAPDDDEREEAQQSLQAFVPPGVDVSTFEPEIIEISGEGASQATTFAPGPFGDRIKARLIWFPLDELIQLTWEVMLAMPDYEGLYRILIDTQNGEVLYCHPAGQFCCSARVMCIGLMEGILVR
jgi:hypothetical protein